MSSKVSGSKIKHILIVEDNKVFARILAQTLVIMCIKYDVVTDGLEAIEICKERSFDLILMDIMMPRMDGMDATRIIRGLSKHNSEVPIIAVTARLGHDSQQEYTVAGMTDVIKKPISTKNLFDMLRKHLNVDEKTAHLARLRHDAQRDSTPDMEELNSVNWIMLKQYQDRKSVV